jgi:hypothetical protein
MFPTVEVSVIELVLETCGGSTDRSIEQLLSMTDDNFKPDELESVRREEAVSTLHSERAGKADDSPKSTWMKNSPDPSHCKMNSLDRIGIIDLLHSSSKGSHLLISFLTRLE